MAKKQKQPGGGRVLITSNRFHHALWNVYTVCRREWTRWDKLFPPCKLDALTEQAVMRLMEAGLVELRLGVAVRWIGYPYFLQVILEVCGGDTEPEVDRQVKELAEGAPGWVSETVSECKTRIEIFPMAARLASRGDVLGPPCYSDDDVLHMLKMAMENRLTPCSPSVNLIDFRPWVPSDLQREIWKALDGTAMTTDKLEARILVARATLFKKPGGLPEMLELGLIKNDRQMGGYYRPDHAPKNFGRI